MTKYKLSIRQEVFNYMDKFPYTTNTDIALKFNIYNENSVKTYRTQWLKKSKPKTKGKSEIEKNIVEEKLHELLEDIVYTKVNEETIEATLLNLVNAGQLDAGLVRCMIDFFIKIKGKTDTIEENIDMEVLRQIGINVKNNN